jgi:hypothetical protein
METMLAAGEGPGELARDDVGIVNARVEVSTDRESEFPAELC